MTKTKQRMAHGPAWVEAVPGRKLSRAEAAARTRERILQESMRLFATESYDGVSMRDIAGEIGIKSSSIYNYYESKEELLREILERFAQGCERRLARLRRAAREEDSLEGFVDLLFEQFLDAADLELCYGAAILLKEQFNDDDAREMTLRLLGQDGVGALKQLLDQLVQRGLLEPCDTRMASTLFVYSALACAGMYLHELLGRPVPVASERISGSLREFLMGALQKGI